MENEVEVYKGVLSVAQKESDLIAKFTEKEVVEKMFLFAPVEIDNWKEEKKEMFLKKTVVEIAHDQNLTECFDSNEGKLSIMNAVQKSCSSGLQIGGKHVFLVPQGRTLNDGRKVTEARYSIKADGYFALLCGGEKPILRNLRWNRVYKSDQCSIDAGAGEVEHKISISGDRGEFIGCWVQVEKINGQKEVYYFDKKKINQWRSSAKTQKIWDQWYEEMSEQACIRHACYRYEQAKDLISQALYGDEEKEEKITNEEAISEALEPKVDLDEKEEDDF